VPGTACHFPKRPTIRMRCAGLAPLAPRLTSRLVQPGCLRPRMQGGKQARWYLNEAGQRELFAPRPGPIDQEGAFY
jgi:hypothetical protein